MRALVATLAVSLAVVGAATASEQRPTLAELEREVICPTCHTTLNLSDAPVADRMRAFISERIAAGETKSQIKSTLVAEFGEGVLAAPSKEGFNLLAWLLPLAGLAAGGVVVGVLVRRWVSARAAEAPADPSTNGRAPLDPELERRLDEELARFEG
jgi:cytochrome c-type biogenesis protein CcmH